MAPNTETLSLDLPGPAATDRLAQRLAEQARGRDCLLLSGPIGAGKSHLARSMIHALQAAAGQTPEDVPSPTFTLVQVYQAKALEIWHADLYRLTDTSEVEELGLTEAMGTALCLIEWPDRLGSLAPADALNLALAPTEDGSGRTATLSGADATWGSRLRSLAQALAA